MKRFAAVVLVVLLLLSSACAESAGPLFTASASVPFEAPADSAVITLMITADSELLSDAESAAAASVASLTDALVAAGAREEDISAVRTDVQADWKYHYNKLQEPQLVLNGRSVAYAMTVAVPDIALLDALLDAAVNNGLYASYEVALNSSDGEASYRAAMESAAKTAVEKAKALAKACGFLKTTIVSVTELACEGTMASVEAVIAAE